MYIFVFDLHSYFVFVFEFVLEDFVKRILEYVFEFNLVDLKWYLESTERGKTKNYMVVGHKNLINRESLNPETG